MKKIIYFIFTFMVLILLLYIMGFNKQRGEQIYSAGDSVFAGTQVHTINMSFSQPNYWDSLLYYYNQGNEQCMAATVTVNGVVYNNVGVRMKGNSSFTHPNNKKPFKISFNEYVSGQKWNGLKSVSLNNCWNDPTFIREKLYLDMCRSAGISAPRCNFVRLTINDTLFAFYSMVESVDKTFLDTRYGDNSGIYFKAVDGRDTGVQVLSDFRWLGADTSLYIEHYELKVDGAVSPWSKLVNFIDTLNHSSTMQSSLSNYVNLSSFYRAMSMDIITANLDAYIHSGRNFYFYFNPVINNKIDWIIWDASLAYGAMPGQGITNIENLSVTYVIDSTQRPFLGKVINTPTLKTAYLMALCSIYKSYFSTQSLFSHIDSIANVIRSYVYEDPKKMYTNAQFETNIISDLTILGDRKPGLKSYITLRENSIQNQLTALGIDCENSINTENELYNMQYELNQNYPNPFNPETVIKYSIPKTSQVTIRIYNILGQNIRTLVNNKVQNSGTYTVTWNGKDENGIIVSSGIYFYCLETPAFGQSKRMLLLK
jgi:hypothetical protein